MNPGGGVQNGLSRPGRLDIDAISLRRFRQTTIADRRGAFSPMRAAVRYALLPLLVLVLVAAVFVLFLTVPPSPSSRVAALRAQRASELPQQAALPPTPSPTVRRREPTPDPVAVVPNPTLVELVPTIVRLPPALSTPELAEPGPPPTDELATDEAEQVEVDVIEASEPRPPVASPPAAPARPLVRIAVVHAPAGFSAVPLRAAPGKG